MFMSCHVTNKMETSNAPPVRPPSTPSYSATTPDGGAIFHEISPATVST